MGAGLADLSLGVVVIAGEAAGALSKLGNAALGAAYRAIDALALVHHRSRRAKHTLDGSVVLLNTRCAGLSARTLARDSRTSTVLREEIVGGA